MVLANQENPPHLNIHVMFLCDLIPDFLVCRVTSDESLDSEEKILTEQTLCYEGN